MNISFRKFAFCQLFQEFKQLFHLEFLSNTTLILQPPFMFSTLETILIK